MFIGRPVVRQTFARALLRRSSPTVRRNPGRVSHDRFGEVGPFARPSPIEPPSVVCHHQGSQSDVHAVPVRRDEPSNSQAPKALRAPQHQRFSSRVTATMRYSAKYRNDALLPFEQAVMHKGVLSIGE
jgi:hypothetical protein